MSERFVGPTIGAEARPLFRFAAECFSISQERGEITLSDIRLMAFLRLAVRLVLIRSSLFQPSTINSQPSTFFRLSRTSPE